MIQTQYCQYEVIYDVAKECAMRVSDPEDDDWDIWFQDGPIQPTFMQKMKSY